MSDGPRFTTVRYLPELIGGPAHGRHFEVPRHAHVVKVPVDAGPFQDGDPVTPRVARYRRMMFLLKGPYLEGIRQLDQPIAPVNAYVHDQTTYEEACPLVWEQLVNRLEEQPT